MLCVVCVLDGFVPAVFGLPDDDFPLAEVDLLDGGPDFFAILRVSNPYFENIVFGIIAQMV